MKKLLYCFALFAVTSIVCLIVAYGITRYSVRQEQAVPNTGLETETVNDVDDRPPSTGLIKAQYWKAFLRQKNTILCQVKLYHSEPQHHLPHTHILSVCRKRRGEMMEEHMDIYDGCIPLFGRYTS